jgi:hypothetical protein
MALGIITAAPNAKASMTIKACLSLARSSMGQIWHHLTPAASGGGRPKPKRDCN